MITKIEKMLESDIGLSIYNSMLSSISDHSMDSLLNGGVLLGFSGGADSVMLLLMLRKYMHENSNGKIIAVHINHMIRGDEADRDEAFSRMFCNELNVEFISSRIDVPKIAKKESIGLEEAARNERYSCFSNIISGRKDISCIAVAHNATDNAETVIFNMMRGSGIKGISGIMPVRDNIIRPLIYVPKSDITKALTLSDIHFVNDSTNFSTDYTRNYIRHEILPRLTKISISPENMITRLSKNLRSDSDYLDSEAQKFISSHSSEIPQSEIIKLHPAIFARVLNMLSLSAGGKTCEHIHVLKIRELLSGGNFKFSLPGDAEFISSAGICKVISANEVCIRQTIFSDLKIGFNFISGFGGAIFLSYDRISGKITDSSSKVYKIAIQQAIDSAIIKGGLLVRSKRDGDSYKYGKITHKLKKLFNDRKIPPEYRSSVPVICDESGVLWIPGFGVRDGEDKKSESKIFISILSEQDSKKTEFYIPKKS